MEADGGIQVVGAVGEAAGEPEGQRVLDALADETAFTATGAEIGLAAPYVGAVRLSDCRHVVLALASEPVREEPLAETALLVAALVDMSPSGVEIDHARLFRDLTADPAPLCVRLGQALQRGAELLGMDAAVLLCVEAEEWHVESVCDPIGIVDVEALLASGGLASMTYRASGAVGIHDVGGSSFNALEGIGAFLGAPIVAGRQGLGVLAFLGTDAKAEAFSTTSRGLVETLARWAGVALGGQASARRLATQEATLACMVESSPHPVGLAEWVVAVGEPDDLEITTTNDAAARLLGAGPGDRLSQVLPPSVVRLWTGACRRALTEGSVQQFRAVVVPPGESEPRRLAVSLALVESPEACGPASHGAARITFLAEDVTARRHIRDHLHRREAQLRSLLERAPVMLFELDEAGRFTFCEGRALALSGIRPGDLIGASAFDRYRAFPDATQALGRVLAGEPTTWNMTLGRREFEIYAQPARTRDDDSAGARGVAVDVTERREAERIAAATLEEAVADSLHSADLVSLLSHGLRMPLATVLGYADLLVNDAETDTPEAGGAIVRAASEILETLDGFLDLTRLSALRTAAPTAIGTSGLRATIESAAAEGASGVPATLDVAALGARDRRPRARRRRRAARGGAGRGPSRRARDGRGQPPHDPTLQPRSRRPSRRRLHRHRVRPPRRGRARRRPLAGRRGLRRDRHPGPCGARRRAGASLWRWSLRVGAHSCGRMKRARWQAPEASR